jgi:biotin carboxylase
MMRRVVVPNFYILDERQVWHKAACEAALRAGYQAERIFSGHRFETAHNSDDVAFIRPHADWRRLPDNRDDYKRMVCAYMTVIQDDAQVQCYEDKTEQFLRWHDWMPDTWLISDQWMAMSFLDNAPYPLVSKANEGASSINVRILKNKDEAQKHIAQLFGAGILVHHGANCPQTRQKGYALLQRFIPHTTTWRVNGIGDDRAVFKRYCYKDRPVAQTGNSEATYELTPEIESLLEYSDRVLKHIGSKWCALDILKDEDGSWKLLETSLAWPWETPSKYDNGTWFRSTKGRKWSEHFDVMFDELERGAWRQ